MMAMLRIHSSEVLARLGWKLLLQVRREGRKEGGREGGILAQFADLYILAYSQIHDEVIVEGPDESKEEALAEVCPLTSPQSPTPFFPPSLAIYRPYPPSLPPCLLFLQVKRCMEHPNDNFGLGELMVKLEVDAKVAKSWYEAK